MVVKVAEKFQLILYENKRKIEDTIFHINGLHSNFFYLFAENQPWSCIKCNIIQLAMSIKCCRRCIGTINDLTLSRSRSLSLSLSLSHTLIHFPILFNFVHNWTPVYIETESYTRVNLRNWMSERGREDTRAPCVWIITLWNTLQLRWHVPISRSLRCKFDRYNNNNNNEPAKSIKATTSIMHIMIGE